jgi:hypothetical protein
VGRSRLIDHAERARCVLAWVVAGCAAAMLVSGLFAKSTRWTDISGGQSMAWADGIKPWAAWSVLGGAVILLLLLWTLWTDRWIPLSVASLLIFWRVATLADTYRSRLESADWLSTYDHQRIAFGLRAVPFIAMIGLLGAMLLALVATWLLAQGRRAEPHPASA